MYCFNHNIDVALGICKFCQKALCKNCIEILSECVSCNNPGCQTNIKEELEMMERGKKIYRLGKYNRPISLLSFSTLSGLIITGYGVYDYFYNKTPSIAFDIFLVCIGIIYLVSGLMPSKFNKL